MTYFQVNAPNVIHEIIDGEVVLINLETGSYYSIDSVGAVVWECIGQGLNSDQIVEVVATQYSGDAADIAEGVRGLFHQLQTEQLILPSEVSSSNGHTAPVQGGANVRDASPFEAPVLHKYTDMEDLLLLDPIHDVDESGWPHVPEDD